MGFCNRCGEVVRGASKCTCGGLGREPASNKVLLLGDRSVTPDKWYRHYTSKSPKSTLRSDATAAAASQQASSSTKSDSTLAAASAAAAAAAAGLAKSGSGEATSPSAEMCEETIARAFGSVLDPLSQRQKWACFGCKVLFVRDQTVYPHPRARTSDEDGLDQQLFCRACFSHQFSLGDCVACGVNVPPDAATPFVQRDGKLWHASCYVCSYCSKDLSKNPQVDLFGNPCCASCFDRAAFLKSPNVKLVPALLSADADADGDKDEKKKKLDPELTKKEERKKRIIAPGATRLGPTVNELRSRLESVALETTPATATETTSIIASPSPSPRKPEIPSPSVVTSALTSAPSKPDWQRHRSTRSLIIPAVFCQADAASQASPVASSSKANASLHRPPPPAPISDNPTRPQRTGRSQSMYDVPSATDLLKSPVAAARSEVNSQVQRALKPVPPLSEVKQDHENVVRQSRPLPRPPAEASSAQMRSTIRANAPTKGLDTAQRGQSRPSPPESPATTADSRCAACKLRLFAVSAGATEISRHRIISLARSGERLHARCFVCSVCQKQLEGSAYVQLNNGKLAHEPCADRVEPPTSIIETRRILVPTPKPEPSISNVDLYKATVTRPLKESGPASVFQQQSSPAGRQKHSSAVQMTPFSPSKIQVKHPPGKKTPVKLSKASEIFASREAALKTPAFGGLYPCAGCGETGTMAETTLGPVGTRFHHGCLKCRCGKKLDSGAKSLDVISSSSSPEKGYIKRQFACRDCIDKHRLAQRSLSGGVSSTTTTLRA